jgi:CheY-like chemotaxis protein
VTFTVLAVDDAADNRKLLTDVLGRAGFRVQTAGTARQALEQAPAVDAVLLDVSLPDLSGLDACRLLRDDPSTADLPVLLVSGHSSARDVRAGMAVGADGYLVKPYSPARLVAELNHLLGAGPEPDRDSAEPAGRDGAAAAASTAAALPAHRSGARLLRRYRPARSA